MSAKLIQIQWTCGSIDEARKVARYLVQERYVACANIIPWVESIYMWDNQLNTEQETKVIFKTRPERFDAVKEVILKNTAYEVPEITAIPIEQVNDQYLAWLEESTPEPTHK
jgi:periplasmic divalent cation tolerance protein